MTKTDYSATYLYDGDGMCVAQIVNGTATYYFMGGVYELALTNGTVTGARKYYSLAGQLVAMNCRFGLTILPARLPGFHGGSVKCSGIL
jgi:hypothetical protein